MQHQLTLFFYFLFLATVSSFVVVVIVEICFIFVFLGEMIIKLAALGWHKFFESKFNCFDCIVVFASALEVLLVHTADVRPIGLSAFRAFRLLRTFRESEKLWKRVNDIVASMITSSKLVVSLLFLVLIYLVIISLLAMQLFGGR